MRVIPVVSVHQVSGALAVIAVAARVGPFPQAGLDGEFRSCCWCLAYRGVCGGALDQAAALHGQAAQIDCQVFDALQGDHLFTAQTARSSRKTRPEWTS